MQKVYFINCISLGFFIYLCTHLFLTLSSYFYFNNLILYGTSIVSSIKSLLNTIWDTDNNSDIHKFYSLNLSMEKVMSPHSSTLAWQIPWAEEPGRLQSMVLLRVGHDWATSLSLFTFMHWKRKWKSTPVFLPRESQGWGSLVGCRLWGHTELDTTEAT